MILLAAVVAVVAPFLPTHQNGHAARVRQAIGKNGSDFITYRFPGNETTGIAFTPDGDAFALTRGGILKIALDGTESYVPTYGPSLRTTEATIYVADSAEFVRESTALGKRSGVR